MYSVQLMDPQPGAALLLWPIGLYREYAIAIQDEVGDSIGGNV